MSKEGIIIQTNENKKDNLDIIEEKIGNTKIPFSEVFKFYTERILDGGDDNLFKNDDLINLNMEEKNKFEIKGSIIRDLFYDGEIVYPPIMVNFENGNINKTYKMFTKKYFNEIYNGMNFNSPILLIGYSLEKYNNSNLFIKYNEGNKIYKIFEKKKENYTKFYSTKIRLLKECNPSDLTPNFNYYFAFPKKKCQMKFSFNTIRRQSTIPIFNFENNKINPIFGPYGSGKTTTLIIFARSNDNTCYLNLNALYKNKDNLHVWKYDLLLKELYNIFKKDEKDKKIIDENGKKEDNEEIKENKDKKIVSKSGKEEEKNKGKNSEQGKTEDEEKGEKSRFEKIKEKVLQSNHFWEAITLSIEFCIENKINSIFILDQYKEEIDLQFSQFKEIKNLINDEKNIYVKLVVASSTNNSDIRDFIIKKYVKKLSKQQLINDYFYIQSLFKLTDIKGLIDIIPEPKKNMLEEYFSNIPSYFYILYESDADINTTKEEIKKIITQDIQKFYEINSLTRENLCFIINNYLKIGDNLNKEKKDDTEIIEEKIIKTFIEILPIKYFTFDIQDGAIVKIYFYFKLAKICFLEFIYKQFYEFIQQPMIDIPERTIGDLLEIIVIENLKDNSFENIEQIVKVDSIWEMNTVQEFDKSKVKENNILIIQADDSGKKVDFGFLLKGETLVLVQCKKALSGKPKEYIKISDISKRKKNLYDNFSSHFCCNIKKIKLLYLTGIYFIDKDKFIYRTWSKNDTSFDVLEKIAFEDQIPLVFFDVQEKKILIQKNYNDKIIFEPCKITDIDSLIYNEEIYRFEAIDSDKNEVTQIIDELQNNLEKNMIELTNYSIIAEKSENEINKMIIEEHLEKKNIDKLIIPNKRIIITKPDTSLLGYIDENILTTFKIKNNQYFCFYDNNNEKMKYAKVEKGEAKDFEFNDLKIYFLKKKTERVKSKKK